MLKFNRLAPLFLALFLPVLAFAQGVVVSPQTALKTINGATSPIAGATITVCAANTSGLPCSPALAGVTFKDAALTAPLANPFTADANGNYSFAIASGTYTVTVTASGFAGYSYQLSVTCPPAGPCTFSAITVTTVTASGSISAGSLSVSGAASLPALTATSPVINGTPSGTGIGTLTLKKGSGGGNYTSASTSYVAVDGTNLLYTVTIPTGWKLAIAARGDVTSATAAVLTGVAIADGGVVIVETQVTPATVNVVAAPFALAWVVNGDGASHTIDLRYKTSNAADSVVIANAAATLTPTMVFTLMPSN